MNRVRVALTLSLAAAASCATTPRSPEGTSSSVGAASAENEPRPVVADEVAAVVQEPMATAGDLSSTSATSASASSADASPAHSPAPANPADELSIWDDPRTMRRLEESYLAETEVEPRITEKEYDDILEIIDQISSENYEEALRLLDEAGGEEVNAVFDFTRANIYLQTERYEDAAKAYETAVDKFPKFRRAWTQLGQAHVRLGDFESALPAFIRTFELGGGDATTYGLMGFAHSNSGNHLAAETAYRMATLLDPQTLDWKKGLAFSLFEQERFADAAALCDALIDESPEAAEFWLLQANAFIRMEEPLRAAENYELVDGLGKSTVGSLTNLGDIYINEQLFDLGVDAYIRAMETAEVPDPSRAIRAAKALTANGALEETLVLVEGIERVQGDGLSDEHRIDVLKLRARLAVASGASDEEAATLEEIVALDPLDGEALILLGQHSRRAGDDEKAIFYYERAAAIEASEAMAKLRHAELLVGDKRYKEALPLLRRSLVLSPRDDVQDFFEQVERASQQNL